MASNTKTVISNRVKNNFFFKVYKSYIIDSIFIVKNHGFKALFKRKGLKFFLIIVLYYLVRDTILYIVIPFLIAKGVVK